MTNDKARPFHYGTEVVHVFDDSGQHGPVWTVRGCEELCYADETERRLFLRRSPPGGFSCNDQVMVMAATSFKHASDGAPLGDWEPLSADDAESLASLLQDNFDMIRDRINSILREEADNAKN